LNEGADVSALGGVPYVSVTPLCGIAKKRRVTHLGRGLPMPLSRVLSKERLNNTTLLLNAQRTVEVVKADRTSVMFISTVLYANILYTDALLIGNSVL
jgi:hypothetical protein